MTNQVTFTLPTNNQLDFIPRDDGKYSITNKKGESFVCEPPFGVLTHNGVIAHDLIAKVYKDESFTDYQWLNIGFANGDNKEVYKNWKKTLKAGMLVLRGYDELKALLAAHAEYHNHLNDALSKGETLTIPKPADYEAMAEQYPVAALMVKAEQYQNSNNLDKYSAGKKAAEYIQNGQLNDAKCLLKNWFTPKLWPRNETS